MTGITLTPKFLKLLKASGSYSKIAIKTPGLFGPDPDALKGPCSWISLTAYFSYSALYMGYGIGEIDWFPGIAKGIDIGFDIMGGFSIRVR